METTINDTRRSIVDVNSHPILQKCYDLGAAIQELPPSLAQTDLTIMCSNLLDAINNELAKNVDNS